MNIAWSHAVLRCRDIGPMVEFYCDMLGFEVADRGEVGPDTEIVFLSGSSSDHHQLGLLRARGPEDASSLDHMAFRTDSLADVKAMITKLEADERVEFAAPVTHGNAVSVYFSDPEGNGIEVFCDTPWHVQQPQISGWDPTQTDAEVLADLEERFSGDPEFRPMAEYRAERAAHFGE
jgi:catechol 2,3-dioxygenase